MLDYAPGNIVYLKFATVRPSTGAPFALSGGTISVYKDNSTTQSTTGVSLTADFDGVTGLNHVTIDTSADGTFYSAGSSFQVVITAGTVDSVSVVGQPVGEFTLNRAAVLSRLPSSLVSGRIDASVGAMAANTLTASALATDAVAEIQSGLASQISVDDLPTNAELATALASADDATLSAIAAEAIKTAAIKAKTDNLPSDPADASDIAASFSTVNGTLATLATASNLATVAGYLDTEIATILAIANKLDSAMELDGIVWRFTTNALEQAPTGGGGGGTDWTANERTAIRTILGVPASGTTPEVPSAGALKVIDDLLDTEMQALTTALADVPTVAEFEARTIVAANYATATELAKVIKTGEEFTATDGTGTKDVTFTRI